MSDDTIFREVDDELRSERMRTLWRRFAPWIIGAAVLIVLLVAANEGWRWWQQSTAARSSDQYYEALDLAGAGDTAAALAALDATVAEGTGAYPVLARFAQAGLLAAEGRADEALAAYDALAAADTNPRLRELALVLGATLLVDGGDVDGVRARVGGLIDAGNPMRNAARELLGLAQYRAGDVAGAAATFDEVLADPLASSDLVGRVELYRAQAVAQGLADDSDLVEPAPEPVAEEAETPAADDGPAPADLEQFLAPAEDGETDAGVAPSDLDQFLAPAGDDAEPADEPAAE